MAEDRRHHTLLKADDGSNQSHHGRLSAVAAGNVAASQNEPFCAGPVDDRTVLEDLANILAAVVPLCHPIARVTREQQIGVYERSLAEVRWDLARYFDQSSLLTNCQTTRVPSC